MNAAAVSKALKANGFARSTETTTRVKGWHDFTSGFDVKQGYGDSVAVFYEFGSGFNNSNIENRDEVRAQKLATYAAFLTAKGYAVVENNTYLSVTKKVGA